MKNKITIILSIIGIIVFMSISVYMMFNDLGDKKANNDETQNNQDIASQLVNDASQYAKDNEVNLTAITKYSNSYPSVSLRLYNLLIDKLNNKEKLLADTHIQDVKYIATDIENTGGTEKYIKKILDNGSTLEDLIKFMLPTEYAELDNAVLLGDDNKSEYPENLTNIKYLNLLKLFTNKDYQGVIDDIDNNILKSYKLTESYNYQIGYLYNDAKLALNYESQSEEGKTYGVKQFKDPVAYYIYFNKLKATSKLDFLTNYDSIIPFAYSNTNISNLEYLDMKNLNKNISELCDTSIKKVIKLSYYDMNQEDTYTAYISYDNNFKSKILLIQYNGTARTDNKTVREYKLLLSGVKSVTK